MWRPETNADRAANERRANPQPAPVNNNTANIDVTLPSWQDSDYLFKCLYGVTYILTCCGCCSSITDYADFVRGED